ncbi:OmpH family outer membrane protein [Roseobacter litoralis]|uniref:OmpH family outer membrane protein n=1 Tax=Roseobacter litoralis TaxID=42443 RepID=UPI002491E23D|nr:OmpH family outer membrane protein [Roseobacter litoralis]
MPLRPLVHGLALAVFCAVSAQAQPLVRAPIESPILTIDSDTLFEDSRFGRQTIEEFEKRGAALASENRSIEEALEAEEKDLTALRASMTPIEFRTLADAFDQKVQETRRTQEAKNRELNSELESRRVMFLNAAAPVLEQLMREAGAAVVLERRSIFISSNAVDITQIAINRLNVVLNGVEFAPEQQ